MNAPLQSPGPGSGAGPGGVAVTWAGHATCLIELDGVRLLTDPLLGDRLGPLQRIAAAVDRDVSTRLDAVLLSHLHADHAHMASLRQIEPDVPLIAPPGAGAWLTRRGIRNIRELAPGQHTGVGGVRVEAVPAAHGRNRHPGGPSATPVGFVVRGSRAIYFAGDTDLFASMSSLRAIDLALIPVWGWGPTLGPGHLDPERAATAVARIAPRVAVPIHWGTLALPRPLRGRAEPAEPARLFASLVAERAPAVEVRLLAPGARTELAPAGRG